VTSAAPGDLQRAIARVTDTAPALDTATALESVRAARPAADLLAVVLQPAKGRCVVAARPIPKGTLVLADPVVIVPRSEAEHVERTVLGRYVFTWDDDGNLCAVLGLGSLVNHAPEANVELDSNLAAGTMDFVAARDIAAGEELVYDYGYDARELERTYGIPAGPAGG
jgi:hypothetical protein